jgi:hypothetical protein
LSCLNLGLFFNIYRGQDSPYILWLILIVDSSEDPNFSLDGRVVDTQDLQQETTMAKTASKSEPTTETPEAIEPTESPGRPTEEEIAVRAYQIYKERGETEGNPTDDWLQAERELTEGL